MSSKASAAIGTCPCPVTGCNLAAAVKRFGHKAVRDTARRYAGKLFLNCPTHGRLGMDGAAAMQEYILANATMYGPAELEHAAPIDAPATSSPAPEPHPAQVPSSGRVARTPTGSTEEARDVEPKREGFGFWS